MRLKERLREALNLLPIIAFVIPFIILYLIQDVAFSYSFEATWKGRAFYIFFIWFAVLEMIVSWEKLQPKAFKRPKYVRTVALILALSLPTIYSMELMVFEECRWLPAFLRLWESFT